MNASLFASSPRIDRALRLTAKTVCLILVDVNIILLAIPLTRLLLTLAGVAPLRAVEVTLHSLCLTIPAVLLITALLILRRPRATTVQPPLESSFHKSRAENHSVAAVC